MALQQALRNLVSNASNYFGLTASNESSTQPPKGSSPITIGKIYFLHLRYWKPGRPGKFDDPPRFDPRGGATIAYRCVADNYEKIGNVHRIENYPYYVIQMGVAHCKYPDIFNKRIGRDISTARLLAGDSDVVTIRHHPTIKEVLNEVKETFYLEKEIHVPTIRLIYK